MKSYESFAEVYDTFMDNVDYDGWCDYLTAILRKYGVSGGLVCELGCGTGCMTERLAAKGYDMIGIDSSVDMLNVAEDKKLASGHDILYLNQDMRRFELYGTVRAVVSVCDSMNYLTEPEDMWKVLRLVNNYLDPGGIFVFDLNTAWKFEQIGDSTIAENRDEGSFIWENSYDPEKKINEYMLTLFLPEENGLYRREEELHVERAYSPHEVRELISRAGMKYLDAFEAFTWEAPSGRSERICYIAQECGKTGKEEF